MEKQLSKEQILSNCLLSQINGVHTDNNYVFNAMDIHSKQTAIGFAQFAMDKTLQDLNTDDNWTLDDFSEVTNEQLYSLYLQSL